MVLIGLKSGTKKFSEAGHNSIDMTAFIQWLYQN